MGESSEAPNGSPTIFSIAFLLPNTLFTRCLHQIQVRDRRSEAGRFDGGGTETWMRGLAKARAIKRLPTISQHPFLMVIAFESVGVRQMLKGEPL
jgi:hypothetical protein